MLLQILFFSVTLTAAQIPQPNRTQIKVMYNERECDSGGTIPVCGPGTQWVDTACVPSGSVCGTGTQFVGTIWGGAACVPVCIPPTISALGIATSASADYDDNQYNIDWVNKLLSVTSDYTKAHDAASVAATNAYGQFASTGTADAADAGAAAYAAYTAAIDAASVAAIDAAYAYAAAYDAAYTSAKLNAAYDAGKAVSDKAGWYAIAAAAVYTAANICIV
jgi:hypothetical protein